METPFDIAQILATLFAAAGLFLSAVQIARARAERRAEYVIRVIERLHDNPQLHNMYYELERGQFEFNISFLASEKEKQLDRLLEEFDLLARLYKMNLIRLEDLELFWYQFLVIYQNKHVRQYVDQVNKTFEQSGLTKRALEAFYEVGHLLEEKYGKVQPWRE